MSCSTEISLQSHSFMNASWWPCLKCYTWKSSSGSACSWRHIHHLGDVLYWCYTGLHLFNAFLPLKTALEIKRCAFGTSQEEKMQAWFLLWLWSLMATITSVASFAQYWRMKMQSFDASDSKVITLSETSLSQTSTAVPCQSIEHLQYGFPFSLLLQGQFCLWMFPWKDGKPIWVILDSRLLKCAGHASPFTILELQFVLLAVQLLKKHSSPEPLLIHSNDRSVV